MNPSPNAAPRGDSPTRVAWWVIALIVLGSFFVRVADYDGPYYAPDEDITVKVVAHMRQSGVWDINWAKADLPLELRYDQYNFSSHLYAEFLFYRLVKILPGTLAWRSADDSIPVYRFFSVLLATLVVWQSMSLGQRLGGRAVAIGAGVLTGAATQLVQDAHFTRPEAFTTALMLAVVIACWPREQLSVARIAGGAFAVGLLVACKVSLLLIAWLPLVSVIAAWSDVRARGRALALVPIGMVAGFAVGAPGAVLHPAKFIHGVQHLMMQYASLHPPHSHLNGGPMADVLGRFFWATLGWAVLACAALGAFQLGRRRRWAEFALVVGPVLVFAGYFATKSVFFERNLSHVLPLVLLLAACGAVQVATWLAPRLHLTRWATIGVVIALLALRPARLTHALVTLAFSAREDAERGDFARALHARYPEAEALETTLIISRDVDTVASHLAAGRGSLLLRVNDYHDEWTAACLKDLAQKFDVQPLAEWPGSFSDVPVSTLTVYHSWTDRYYLVRRRVP